MGFNHNENEIDFSKYLSKPSAEHQEKGPYFVTDISSTPKMIRWVIEHSGGLIKNEKQAFYFLMGIVVLMIAFSLFLIFTNFSRPNIPSEALERPERGLPIKD